MKPAIQKRNFLIILLVLFSITNLFSQVCNYTKRKRITFDPTKVSGPSDFTDFPALINITSDNDLRTTGNGGSVTSASGFDIVFTDADGVTLLDFQLEKYTATTGEYVAHVRIPTLSTSVNTYIYLYYGNAAVVTDQSVTTTWDANYKSVWHLHNSSFNDGTVNANTATNSGSTNLAAAQIAGGRTFSGAGTNYVQVPMTGMSGGSGNGTVELWGRVTTYVTSRYFFGETTNQNGTYANRVQLYLGDAAGTLYLGMGSNHNLNTNVQTLALNTWYHIVLTWATTGAGVGTYFIYVNGVQKGTGAYAGFTAIHTFADLGNDGNAGQRTEELTGNVDEVRVSSIARSIDYAVTAYNNQSSPSTFYTVTTPRVWTGGTNTVWSNTANWAAATVPAANEDAIITNGANQPTLDINQQLAGLWVKSSATLNLGAAKTLTMRLDVTNCGTITGATGSLVMNSDPAFLEIQSQALSGGGTYNLYNLTINNIFATTPGIKIYQNVNTSSVGAGTLTMTSGNVNLNGFTLTLGNSAANAGTLSRTAGWLYGGTFTRWFNTPIIAIANIAGLLPMGTSTVDYRPVWVANSAILTSGGTVSVVHNPTYPSWHTVVNYNDATWAGGTTVVGISNSSWVISTANGLAFNGATGQIRFGGTGFGTFVLTDLNASLVGSAVGTFGAATSVNTALEANRTALTTAQLGSTWYIGSKNNAQSPLPIELTQFTATPTASAVNLNWTTATETNNDYFTVEKTKDGNGFEEVARVNGAGNSSFSLNYQTADESPYAGQSYYRLKQTDFNGMFTYSYLVPVNFDNNGFSLNVFPNPSDGSTTSISINTSANKAVLVVLLNALGQESYSKIILTEKNGENIYAIDQGQKLAAGVYIITASSDDKICQKKLIIK